ncbi:MAG: helix-turn-helix domain-containing protein [Rhodospirillales bacterium]
MNRRVTHYQLANIVGSTRQWVSTTLEKWQTDDIIVLRDRRIDICRVDLLNDLLAA